MNVKKAILPVAGFGTRLLPASKSIPKEMITVVDRPAIDYVVQEAVAAGIDTIILVTHPAKHSIENYFDRNKELEALLEQKKKDKILDEVRRIIPDHVSVIAVRQPEPLGLGHAVLCAEKIINNEPFAVLLPDVLVDSTDKNNLQQMIEQFDASQASQIMVEDVEPSRVDQYGIVALEQNAGQPTNNIVALVEKPAVDQAPSTLAVVGRYIFTPEIFTYLHQTQADKSGEIQLTDAMAKLLEIQKIQAFTLKGYTYDCGSKIGYLKAVVHYALKRSDLNQQFSEFLATINHK
ncbi:UTP--glucose-1-phosphate uridylyltransferase GalU [Acinetobacter qingfengensis]|uniref:UTP--glucose-1-phosphate uridylyltransferase n=1 Tax=Acinetobacter qingfengensis TaxID=1262585 RepID=A0A1E7RFR5_9GAMM|nr:UTP--glucose-1-phosphate uridylyltransferase GalU [Acinetobacter qingfengensis]KAA8731837.1 UTP--glucose-1-phosphate uridylyltransferase GalU [Acinetobacter qingfengensis]OEY98214.1 UTP--glucose-1-phosphate uridylyltransferase [Acinetobacter qingfengensis]